jgi:crotonobetainyl-CoA hydratase
MTGSEAAVSRPEPQEPVLVEQRGPVLLMTLNRPRVRNAIDARVSALLGAALARLDQDDDLRVGVITGAPPAFCAGADLAEVVAGRSLLDPEHEERGLAGIVRRPPRKPVIAAVNGAALGGGTEIVLACDLAVMAEDAVLGLPEPRRGLIAGAGGLLRLPRQLPPKIAAELALTGDTMNAADAYRLGLVNQVVPGYAVVQAAMDLAHRIVVSAPESVRVTKEVLDRSSGADPGPSLWDLQDTFVTHILAHSDAAEGMAAFTEKRRPRWGSGRAPRVEENS